MKVMLDPGAFMPERAHSTDAGLDLRTPTNAYSRPLDSVTIDTGVHIQLPPGCAGLMVAKSGLNVNFDILSTGLIDEGYTGSIKVKLYNHSREPYHFQKGDKISQLVVIPVDYVECEQVDALDDSERGDNGFGSSGR